MAAVSIECAETRIYFKEEEGDEEYYDDTTIVKSRMSEFSRGRLKVRMRSWGTCIGRYGPINVPRAP